MSRSPLPGPSESAYLGLGGNIGDPAAAMAQALRRLDGAPLTRIDAVSSLYRTPPWGVADQPDFLNAVARIDTGMSPRELLALCLDIERSMQRVRERRWGPRPIDIDILLFGSLEVDEPQLTIPHPHIAERAFVLVPLAEIAPGTRVRGKPASELAAGIDTSGMERLADSEWWRGD